ncbi:MAG: hypothetical protein ACXWKV_16810 [Caulobacteraceae bacterium]
MDDRTPVSIGAGQFSGRGDAAISPSPAAVLKIAADVGVIEQLSGRAIMQVGAVLDGQKPPAPGAVPAGAKSPSPQPRP